MKRGDWKKARKTVDVEAFIRTRSNLSGLNALLWSLFWQTALPERITIFNTGNVLDDYKIHYALSYFKSVKIINQSNDSFLDDDGVFNHSLHLIECIHNFEKDLVWFFDDDLVIPSDCLEKLIKKTPSMPSYLVEYEPLKFENINDVVTYGILASKEDWKKSIEPIKKKKCPKLGEDAIINQVINPRVDEKTFIAHTTRHNELHGGVYYELHKQLWNREK